MAKVSNRVAEVLAADCGYNTLAAIMEAKNDKDAAELAAVVLDAAEEPVRRQRAAFVLGRMGRKEAIEPLAKAWSELDQGGRSATADALGRIGGAKARDALVKISRDADPQVRKFAVKGLVRIDDVRAKTRLREIATEDAEEFVRRIAERGIAK